ncbi:MAG: hypothetical protein F4X14_17540 [Caldilineaceae bacterium SB0661_bin_32]|uniref:Uncharacterized protein n=1 Tax=Caldilineaceae bacterium SB0661_bin_32 TaxID=2605255 RepID=A0A6B1DBK7_9CHLR|nr:hypothetical protein [Caldilineaceae bacterium SB0661_bin_32]
MRSDNEAGGHSTITLLVLPAVRIDAAGRRSVRHARGNGSLRRPAPARCAPASRSPQPAPVSRPRPPPAASAPLRPGQTSVPGTPDFRTHTGRHPESGDLCGLPHFPAMGR